MSQSIGKRIKELREKKNLSQAQLAKMVGCGQSTLAHWEINSGRLPGNKFLSNIANVLGVSVDYLLGVTDSKEGIPYFGEFTSQQFELPKYPVSKLAVTEKEYKKNRFAIKIKDDLLEPVAEKGDYCIFEKRKPQDNDIVITQVKNMCDIRNWKQEENLAVVSNVNIKDKNPTIFVNVEEKNYVRRTSQESIKVLGVLVVVRKTIKITNSYPHIKYVFS